MKWSDIKAGETYKFCSNLVYRGKDGIEYIFWIRHSGWSYLTTCGKSISSEYKKDSFLPWEFMR